MLHAAAEGEQGGRLHPRGADAASSLRHDLLSEVKGSEVQAEAVRRTLGLAWPPLLVVAEEEGHDGCEGTPAPLVGGAEGGGAEGGGAGGSAADDDQVVGFHELQK